MSDGKAKLEGVARLAEAAQPKGSTLDSAGVHTPVSKQGSLPGYLELGCQDGQGARVCSVW